MSTNGISEGCENWHIVDTYNKDGNQQQCDTIASALGGLSRAKIVWEGAAGFSWYHKAKLRNDLEQVTQVTDCDNNLVQNSSACKRHLQQMRQDFQMSFLRHGSPHSPNIQSRMKYFRTSNNMQGNNGPPTTLKNERNIFFSKYIIPNTVTFAAVRSTLIPGCLWSHRRYFCSAKQI